MRLTTPLLALLLAASCASTESAVVTPTARTAANPADAENALEQGKQALDSKNYVEAEKYFEYVKSKYPFLDAAKEADLRLADTDFDRERYPEARDRYQSFVKLHPTHPRVDYAAFRAAFTHHKEMPSDLFILPPSKEKDQGEVKATLHAMSDFIRTYPQSQHLEEAKKHAESARRRLAEHELYVAAFYAKREKWLAVVNRLKNVVQDYPGLGLEEDAYFQMHSAYLKLKDEKSAKETLRAVVAKLPGTSAAEKAKKLLGPEG
jgi:outer membrane protein assembly factor BamD